MSPQPVTALPRPRLQALLLRRDYRLRLLCAPAGYGKSALLRDCFEQPAAQRPKVVLNMAGGDWSLRRFAVTLAALLGLAPVEAAETALLQHLQNLDAPLNLVLDDYPEKPDADLDAWLDRLLCHCAAPVRLWVSCRQRPNWNLPRLFLDDQLLELGATALAFSREEFDSLASWLHSEPGTAEQAEIWRQTQGWCAGARLLLGMPQTGSQQAHLGDYLRRELLARLTLQERELLARLAYLPRFSLSLCAQLWDAPESHAAIQRLLHSGAFFHDVDADGHWQRLLPAVARALQGEVADSELQGLRLRACGALAAQGFIEDAIGLALDAGQPEVAANYLDRLSPNWLLAADNLHSMRGWCKRLPDWLLHSTPGLIFLNTSALLINYNLDQAQGCLAQLGAFLPQPEASANRHLLAVWQALQGTLLGAQGHAEQAREYCQTALEYLGEDDWQVSYMCHSTLARLAMANGDPGLARQLLLGAVEQARRQECLASEVLINSERIAHMILTGELELAQALLQESLQLLREDGNRHRMQLGRLLVMQGKLQLQRGELGACEQSLNAALEQTREQIGPGQMHSLLGLSEVAAQRGDYALAFRHLQDAERRMQRLNVNEYGYRGVLHLQSLAILVQQRNWEQALPMARQLDDYLRGPTARLAALQSPSFLPRSQLLLAQAEQGVGRLVDAEKRLRTLHRECQRLNFHGLLRKTERLLERLAQSACQPPCAAGGEPLPSQSFNLLLGTPRAGALQAPKHSPLPGARRDDKALTLREVSVLELLAEGLSNQEISERLYISPNTVKTHTKHINHKLGVSRRTQAIVRARAIGVLA